MDCCKHYPGPFEKCASNNGRALSDEQIEWAWKKYCEGYTRRQIADALYVCRRTLDRYFKGKKRVRPKLVYEESE